MKFTEKKFEMTNDEISHYNSQYLLNPQRGDNCYILCYNIIIKTFLSTLIYLLYLFIQIFDLLTAST